MDSGFIEPDFYYPLPDYKFAKAIYSDDRLPLIGELGDLQHNYDMDRMELFDEKTLYNQLIPEGMFDFFANSYLVVAGKQVQK
ncbi:MAG: class I SAM-dependent methyltransferase, partial [Christensenella sp.]|nr:class I SAM-dependent methyltransferase [Christensenella sp.]